MSAEHAGLRALREILSRMYSGKQGGGITGYSQTRGWAFVSSGIGQATPEQLDALFDLVGLQPRPVVPRGACADCRWAKDGRERGYSFPCAPCTRPWLSSFEPAVGPAPDALGLVDRVVRRAQGGYTAEDLAIDADNHGQPRQYPSLIEAAALGGRDAVVRAIQDHIDRMGR